MNNMYNICWLPYNDLCLNRSKSNAVLFGTQQRLRTFPPLASINIACCVVYLSETVIIDHTLNLHLNDLDVNNLCKSVYCHLRALRHIRVSLPERSQAER